MTTSSILFVAHPGHELRLHHWLSRAQPIVHVLTDGSGASGIPRIESTARVLRRCGATPGSIFGRFTDRDIYQAMLTGEATPFAAVVAELAEAIVTSGAQCVVADAWELYNPTHDLCRFLADLAVGEARRLSGRNVECCAFDVVAIDSQGVETLDDAALAAKIAVAREYEELRGEVESKLAMHGEDAFRRERIHAVDPMTAPPPAPAAVPYEARGEEQVARGKYTTVLRYAGHVAPLLAAVANEVRASACATR